MERKGGISGEWNDRKRDRGDGEERTHRKIGIPIHGKKSGKGKKERKKDNDPKWNDEAKRDGERERKNGSGDTFARLSSNSIRDE